MYIDYFHSVMCGYCFIMSKRMRKIVKTFPEIKIIHRSFPLKRDKTVIESDFEGKREIANRIDDEPRLNTERMKNAAFPMSTSHLPMIGIQAEH